MDRGAFSFGGSVSATIVEPPTGLAASAASNLPLKRQAR
jgi:hypothetical protein